MQTPHPGIDTEATSGHTYAPDTPHEAHVTITKIMRTNFPSNGRTNAMLVALITELTTQATEHHMTVKPGTIRIESRPTRDGTEFTLYAFTKPN